MLDVRGVGDWCRGWRGWLWWGSPRPRTALLPIPPPASIRRDSRPRAKTIFYKPHDIRAVSAALTARTLYLPYSQQTTTANLPTLTLCAPMQSTHCSPPNKYYSGDTEEIETAEALRAPDREQFIIAIKKEVQCLISDTKTLQPLTRTATGYAENVDQSRVWKIRATLKCKRKKKSNGEPDKHKARAAAHGDTLRRAMIKAQDPLPASYSPTIMPLTFSPSSKNCTWRLWTSNQPTLMQLFHQTQTGSLQLWSPTSPKSVDWIPHKNTESQMRCMAYQTLVDSSINTTRPPFSRKDIGCPHSITASSIVQRPPNRKCGQTLRGYP